MPRGTLSENMDRSSSELFEEIGIETDEATGADLGKVELMLGPPGGSTAQPNKRPRTVLANVN
jgi:hypothetical protein